MKLGATTMKMTMIVKQAGFAILVVLGSAYNAAVQAQPATTTTPATAEQEFFDAIKKGNSARVSELLKQQPSLIKARSEEHTSELQSRRDLVCRLLLEKKN